MADYAYVLDGKFVGELSARGTFTDTEGNSTPWSSIITWTQAERAAVGVYDLTEVAPVYDPVTQYLGAPAYEVGEIVKKKWPVLDKVLDAESAAIIKEAAASAIKADALAEFSVSVVSTATGQEVAYSTTPEVLAALSSSAALAGPVAFLNGSSPIELTAEQAATVLGEIFTKRRDTVGRLTSALAAIDKATTITQIKAVTLANGGVTNL